jgi:hypothetical protein
MFLLFDRSGINYILQEPSNVFTAKSSALLDALLLIKSSQPGQYLILSCSLSSIGAFRSQRISAKTHSLICECKEVLRLRSRQLKVRLMSIPAHSGITGMRCSAALLKMVQKMSFTTPVMSWDDLNGVVVSNADC